MGRLLMSVGLMVLAISSESSALAQYGGSRAGVESNSNRGTSLPALARDVVEAFISIEGKAEVRVRPTEVRMVMAVTNEGQTARECHLAIGETIGRLKKSWTEMGIPAEGIVEDFIAVLPVYEWELKKDGGSEVGVEKKAGYRMQTNIHVAMPNDANVEKALAKAFEQGVTDIIAFDYWSDDLDEQKVKAREQAVKAARSKSDQLLGVLFEVLPPVINIQEETTVHYPETLYQSFVNSQDEELVSAWRRDTPFIRAHRPRNTYYRGLDFDGDIRARKLPMHPEISVVSTVRLYFESPAAKQEKKADAK